MLFSVANFTCFWFHGIFAKINIQSLWNSQCVEKSWFFCHSDFTWNQFSGFLEVQKVQFLQFFGLWIFDLRKFQPSEKAKIHKNATNGSFELDFMQNLSRKKILKSSHCVSATCKHLNFPWKRRILGGSSSILQWMDFTEISSDITGWVSHAKWHFTYLFPLIFAAAWCLCLTLLFELGLAPGMVTSNP